MKRSKMLDMLVFSIELHAGGDPSWLEHCSKTKARAYEYANRVLQDIEEAGMLPPPSDGSSDVTELTTAKYRWEKE